MMFQSRFWKPFARLSLLVFLGQPLPAAAGFRSTVKIPDSTPVLLTVMDRLSSASSEIDDPVHFEVSEDVKVSGVVVIPKGSMASGHVVAVQHKGMLGRPGKLEFAVDFVRAPDDSEISVRGQATRKGKSRRPALPTPTQILARGKDLEVPQGTRILVYINGSHEVMVSESLKSAEAASPSPPQQAAPRNDDSSVAFTSTPDHADITVDGKFLGTTPSTIRLDSGDHSVTIEKEGFKAWQRVVTLIPGGKISLDVTLEKVP